MAAQDEFELKLQLTNEYLRSGGTEKIPDTDLLQDIIDFRADIPGTHTSRIRAFMNLIWHENLTPPYVGEDFMPNYKSLLQKSLFFDQIDITTEAQFDKVYDEFKKSGRVLFRGQREASWRLYNKLQRFWIEDKLGQKGWTFTGLLESLASGGREEFEPQILELLEEHNVDTLNDIAVLGYLQHHSCPTSLMDWTYSFGNALYFGMDNLTPNEGAREIDNFFSVYFIEEENMVGMRNLMGEIFEEQGRAATMAKIKEIAQDEAIRLEMEEHFKDRSAFDITRVFGSGLIKYLTEADHMAGFDVMFFSDKDADKGFIFSLNNSKNILHQQGVFVWSASAFTPLEVVGQENYRDGDPEADINGYRFCECFNISKQLAPHIRARLEADGITKEHIYPTPDIDTWPVFTKCLAAGPKK